MDKKPRVIVVTGANKGIGFELIKRLLKTPGKQIVVLTSRNESLGKEAMREIINQNPPSKDFLYYHILDITKKETYAPFFEWIKATFGKIDVLVNNAGVLADNELSPDYRANLSDTLRVIGTNYFSTRDFTEYVLPLLASDGKIINVSSTFGEYSFQSKTFQKKFEDPKFQPKYLDEMYKTFLEAAKRQNFEDMDVTPSCYKLSKAMLNAWTFHILKQCLRDDQQAFTMCPGWCRTDMGGSNAPKKPEEGTETIEFLINLPYKANKDINGKFFRDNQLVELVKKKRAKRLFCCY